MKLVVVQGMSCLGKSTLCERLEKDLPKCKYFKLDEYKERMWDEFGFASIEEREKLSSRASDLCYKEIGEAIASQQYDYILFDYPISKERLADMQHKIDGWGSVAKKTIYLMTDNFEEHEKLWIARSKDFSVRHAGHGASRYQNGVGSDYVLDYNKKLLRDLPTVGTTLAVDVWFNPYNISPAYDTVLDFVEGDL